MKLCERLAVATSTWTIAVVLTVVYLFRPMIREALLGCILLSLAIAMTVTVSLFLCRIEWMLSEREEQHEARPRLSAVD